MLSVFCLSLADRWSGHPAAYATRQAVQLATFARPRCFVLENVIRALSKIVLKDTVIPLIALGEPATQSLQVWAQALNQYFSKVAQSSCRITAGAVAEVTTMSKALSCLCGVSKEGSEQLAELMASQSGNKYLLKAAILQNKYYKTLYNEYMEADSIKKHLQPAIDKSSEAIKAAEAAENHKAMLVAMEDACKQLSLWRNKLKPGSTAPIESELAGAFASRRGGHCRQGLDGSQCVPASGQELCALEEGSHPQS